MPIAREREREKVPAHLTSSNSSNSIAEGHRSLQKSQSHSHSHSPSQAYQNQTNSCLSTNPKPALVLQKVRTIRPRSPKKPKKPSPSRNEEGPKSKEKKTASNDEGCHIYRSVECHSSISRSPSILVLFQKDSILRQHKKSQINFQNKKERAPCVRVCPSLNT